MYPSVIQGLFLALLPISLILSLSSIIMVGSIWDFETPLPLIFSNCDNAVEVCPLSLFDLISLVILLIN